MSDPALSKLVEKQMRNWELARTQRLSRSEPQRRKTEDFVCVSRMVGLEETEIPLRLAKRLGWPLFDREILEAMAGDDRLRRQVYVSMDERDLSWWEEALRGLAQREFVKNDYFHRLCETLLSLACQGSCVFVGRGADLILPPDRGLRVRLIAPLDLRVQRLVDVRNLAIKEASREIGRIEEQRSEFFRRHFHREAGDPTRHDLTINLARFEVDEAVNLVLEARKAGFPSATLPTG